ncbi:MAG: DNA repair protein RecN [Woeseiaceae bacterium]
MLVRLQIRNFAIVDQIEADLQPGMTVLTGETGAGKSILVDALGLVLGERGGAQLVRSGAKRAEFSAEFDVSALIHVRDWLEEQALDDEDECLIRRVINADGRSRAFINGNAVPLQQLKTLGDMLIDIHGQRFHQSLGRRPVQRDLLDHFGDLLPQREQTEAGYEAWTTLRDQLQRLQISEADRVSRLDLLTFQLQELETMDVHDGEIAVLQAERQRLANSGRLAEGVGGALNRLSDNDIGNANNLLAEAARTIEGLIEYDTRLGAVAELLEGSGIQLAEAIDTLRRYGAALDMDPQRRDWVEERLAAIQAVARKHRVSIEELPAQLEKLRAEHDDLSNAEERGKELQQQVRTAEQHYRKSAGTLSSGRRKSAKVFAAAVTDAMAGLGMPGGKFSVAIATLSEDDARPWGIDDIEFQICANPGQAMLPLSRVASGGELSRMSLAIQVVGSDGSAIPTMVFDEVDTGVGGGVAEMVGRRLCELGERRQVLSVTHLPQVASLADQHFRISKVTDGKTTRTGLHALNEEERVEEIARMLGGVQITQKTLEHAAEMLAHAPKKRA